jgi:hypothetical protein
MNIDAWITHPGHAARATRRIYDISGDYAKRGDVGEVCDYLPDETSASSYVVVDFPATGPILCDPSEIRPA